MEPPAPDRPPQAKVGTFGRLVALVGKRGAGKSVRACERALELQQLAGGALVLGHSMGTRMPRTLPDGTPLPIRYHRNVNELHKWLRRRPNDWHIIAPPLPGEDQRPDKPRSSADELISYSMRLSKELRNQAWSKAHPWSWSVPEMAEYDGLPCTPIILIIDEGVAVSGAAGGDRSKSIKADEFNEWLISLRHLHTAALFNIQSATMRSYHILEQANEIDVFQTASQYARNALDAAGADDIDLDQLAGLAKYKHVTIYTDAK